MKNLASPKKLLATLLSLVMVCTMLQCVLLTATASGETIDTLIAAVNADSAVTLDDADEINKISVMYDALADKSAYTDTVTSLKTSLYTLLSEGLKRKTTSKSDFNLDSWVSFNYATNGENCVRIKYGGGNNPHINVGPHSFDVTNVDLVDTALDGFEVMINNYYQYDSSAPRAGFAVQFTPWEYQNSRANYLSMNDSNKRAGMILQFDLKGSQIIINSRFTAGGDVKVGTLALDESAKEKLTLSNFSHKAISISMHATGNAENPYKVVVKLSGDVTPITALIPAEYFDEEKLTRNGKVNIGFPAGFWATPTTFPTGNICTQFDVLGYRNSKTAQTAIENINSGVAAIDVNNVKESDAKTIYGMLDSYNVLSATWDKEHTEYAKLFTLNNKLLTLAKTGYTLPAFSGGNVSDSTIPNKATMASDGYATINFNTATNPSLRVSATPAIVFDGAEFKISNFRNLGTSEAVMGFGINFATTQGSDFAASQNSGMLLYLDIANGKLILNEKYVTGAANNKYSGTVDVETLISDSNVIKSLRNKIFTLGINKIADGKYKVTIKTSDGETVTAEMTVDESKFLSNGKTYFSFNRGVYTASKTYTDIAVNTACGASYGSTTRHNQFDFIGYTNTANIFAANALISAVPEVNAVTANDGNVIYKAEEAYAALNDYEKTCVDGTKLVAVRAKYNELVDAETVNEGYTVLSDACLVYSTGTLNGWWGSFATKLENNGGINLSLQKRYYANRLPVKTPVNMDGLSIRFNNLVKTQGDTAEFAIFFSQLNGNQHEGNGTPHFTVVINTKDGTLKVSTSWNEKAGEQPVYYDIIEDELLKYENLAGAVFSVDFEESNSGNYNVTVNAGGKSVSGIIPDKAFNDVMNDIVYSNNKLLTPNNCYFAVGAWTKEKYQAVDVVGFKTNKTEAAKPEVSAGAQLQISDSISVNYAVDADIITASGATEPYIVFSIGEEVLEVKGVLNSATNNYIFTYPDVAPNMMKETIKATLYATNTKTNEAQAYGTTVAYSIEKYCYALLEKYPNDEKLCDLIVDLLRYGAASQAYTNKTENGLVTDALTEAQKAFGTAYTTATAGKVVLTADATYDSANKQVTWKSASLFLADVVNIRFKFTAADGVDVSALTVKATVGGNEVEVSADRIEQINDSNSYYLYFDGATAARMRDAVAITFYNGDTAVSKTVNYSIENYVGTQVEKNEDESLVEMLKALLCYGDSASVYAN